MSVTHTFVSTKPPSADPNKVGSIEWNDEHVVDITNADINPGAAIDESKLALSYPTHALATIGAPANGLSILGQTISLALSSTGTVGALSAGDYTLFSNKEPAIVVLPASKGGTGIANGALSTLTLPNFPITIAGGVTGGTYTLPNTAGGGTVALLNAANIFTVVQQIKIGSGAGLKTALTIGTTDNYTVEAGVSIAFMTAPGSDYKIAEIGAVFPAIASNGGDFIIKTRNTANVSTERIRFMYTGEIKLPPATPLTGLGPTVLSMTTAALSTTFGDNYYFGLGFSTESKLNAYRNIGFGFKYEGTAYKYPVVIGYQEIVDTGHGYGDFVIGTRPTNTNVVATERLRIDSTGFSVFKKDSAATNTIVDVLGILTSSSGTAAAGLGAGLLFSIETATAGTNKNAGRLWSKWVVPTNGSETSAVGLDAYTNSTAQEFISGQGDAGGVKLAFFGGTRAVQQALAAYTSDGEGAAYTGIDNLQIGSVYAQLTDLNLLRVAYETLRASYDDLRTKLQTSTLVA